MTDTTEHPPFVSEDGVLMGVVRFCTPISLEHALTETEMRVARKLGVSNGQLLRQKIKDKQGA